MNRIQKLRKDKGLMQLELAKIINVHQTAISQWETGKTNPDMATLRLLAEYFDVTTDYLLGRSDDSSPMGTKKDSSNELSKDAIMFGLLDGDIETISDEIYNEVKKAARIVVELEKRKNEQK